MLAVAFSASFRPASGEVSSISECNLTEVKVERS